MNTITPKVIPIRAENEIFKELESLCLSPGYAHVIAYFYFRDNYIKIADNVKPEDLANLSSPDRLCRNEISVLAGLMIKGQSYLENIKSKDLQEMIDKTEELLIELHESMIEAFKPVFMQSMKEGEGFNPFKTGLGQREPIFYAGESAYDFQFIDFSLQKYINDNEWFVKNKGYSIFDAVKILKAITAYQNKNLIKTISNLRSKPLNEWTLLPGFEFSVDNIHNECGVDKKIISLFLESFHCPNSVNNENFNSIDDFNYLNAYPLIKASSEKYICFQSYGLAQAFYETPFFWMNADKDYINKASENRGKFTESFSKSRLESVFGTGRVYGNILIREKGKSDVLGEIDVLVLFGDRAIVLQAKSKKLTLEARKGNELALTRDFQLSVQESYNQGLDCSNFLLSDKFEFYDASGKVLIIPNEIKEVYIACIVSDHYPGLNFQARSFLTYQESEKITPPLVTDVFFIDVLCELLPSPLLLLSYLNRRLRYMEQVFSFNEFSVLGYHLRKNLWIENNQIFHLSDDISAEVDIAMISRRVGLPGKTTPPGILTKVINTDYPVGKILAAIERNATPSVIDFGFLIFTFSENTIKQLNNGLKRICTLTARDGKQHDFSIAIADTGITIHSNNAPISEATKRLLAHCEVRKYACKTNKWHGLILPGGDSYKIRNGITLDYKHEQSAEMDLALKSLPIAPELTDGKIYDYSDLPKKKIGRNDPCLCGSGKKYKKCCL